MKLTRFATLGCQKFAKSKRRRGHNSQTKRPIAKISPLFTLQLLILSTGACFKVILCTFKGISNIIFWFMATLKGWCGRIGSANRGRVANLKFLEQCILPLSSSDFGKLPRSPKVPFPVLLHALIQKSKVPKV